MRNTVLLSPPVLPCSAQPSPALPCPCRPVPTLSCPALHSRFTVQHLQEVRTGGKKSNVIHETFRSCPHL
ncbi:hypothetical protein E2C01_094233 [Portunus trituberculatus]|uniref:Uncharacterized protein n=1 Tax=Portunus trituberculatus TaxID=210409 RepID=A0A5B7K126_PORTR|nr:hypothetical protein [Portunus trituberculatus]